MINATEKGEMSKMANKMRVFKYDEGTLKKARDLNENKGFSQTQIAEALGVHRNTVSDWITKGKIGTSKITKRSGRQLTEDQQVQLRLLFASGKSARAAAIETGVAYSTALRYRKLTDKEKNQEDRSPRGIVLNKVTIELRQIDLGSIEGITKATSLIKLLNELDPADPSQINKAKALASQVTEAITIDKETKRSTTPH